MKVDKSVCTSEISSKETTQDSIIKFENVFATLVENKILAIKQECEKRECKKKSLNFKSILWRKKNLTSNSTYEDSITEDIQIAKLKKNNRKTSLQSIENKIEEGVFGLNEESTSTQIYEDKLIKNELCKNFEVRLDSCCFNNDKQKKSSKRLPEKEKNIEKCDKLEKVETNENMTVSLLNEISYKTPALKRRNSLCVQYQKENEYNCEKIDSVNEECSTQNVRENHENISHIFDRESLRKGDAVHLDDLSSQNTSDIEFSLVSESIRDGNLKKKSSVTYSEPIVKQSIVFISPSQLKNKQTSRRAYSCHSTPVLQRHKHCENNIIQTNSQERLKKHLTLPFFEKLKSHTIVYASQNTSPQTKTTIANMSISSSECLSIDKTLRNNNCRELNEPQNNDNILILSDKKSVPNFCVSIENEIKHEYLVGSLQFHKKCKFYSKI